jgi:hypothetical protein
VVLSRKFEFKSMHKPNREADMKKLFAVAAILALLATPSLAQQTGNAVEAPGPASPPTPEEIDTAVTAVNELAKDKEKEAAYCDVLDEEDAVKEGDTAAAEAAAKNFNAFLASLNDDARLAFNLDETIDRASEEGQRLGGAFLNLERECAAEEATDD